MIILKAMGLLLWLLLVPFCVGTLAAGLLRKQDRTPGTALLCGYFLMFALFEVLGIPIVLTTVYHAYTKLVNWYAVVCVLLALLGVFLVCYKRKRAQTGDKNPVETYSLKEALCRFRRKYSTEEMLGYLLFFAVLGFQIYMAVTRASFDGDDAYYVVQGVAAQQKDSLYRFDAYTGSSAPLDARHALALMPIWEAFIGTMSGLHATIVAHTVIPPVFLGLTYLLYYQIGKKLLSDKKDMLPMFMILIALFQMFGNVSIYTSETFLLTRTWQGKSVAANLVLPAVIWVFLSLFGKRTENEDELREQEDKEDDKGQGKRKGKSVGTDAGYWILLACINLAAGVSSSLAVMLSALLVAGLAFLFACKERKFSILVKAGLSCIPSAVYVLIYLMVS